VVHARKGGHHGVRGLRARRLTGPSPWPSASELQKSRPSTTGTSALLARVTFSAFMLLPELPASSGAPRRRRCVRGLPWQKLAGRRGCAHPGETLIAGAPGRAVSAALVVRLCPPLTGRRGAPVISARLRPCGTSSATRVTPDHGSGGLHGARVGLPRPVMLIVTHDAALGVRTTGPQLGRPPASTPARRRGRLRGCRCVVRCSSVVRWSWPSWAT
jgi:hypothetical protein